MASKNNPVARKEGVVVQEMNGEVLIYDLNKNKAFCLNETSALVWEACDRNKSVSEISKTIGKKLDSPANEDLVWLALDQLKQENLLANSEEIVPEFNGMSRREVIKRVGLGTMIALPIISSLIAPKAVHAGSCAPTGTVLTSTAADSNATQCNNSLNALDNTCCSGTFASRTVTCGAGSCTACSGVCS